MTFFKIQEYSLGWEDEEKGDCETWERQEGGREEMTARGAAAFRLELGVK